MTTRSHQAILLHLVSSWNRFIDVTLHRGATSPETE